MSDYVHNKVIRMRIDENVLKEKFGVVDKYDLEFIKEFKDLFSWNKPDGSKKAYMEIAPTEEDFLDYVIYTTYGDESSDFGLVRYLTDEEALKYLPFFKRINENVTKEDLRFVDFCWYNCCEAPDYFEVGTFLDRDNPEGWLD